MGSIQLVVLSAASLLLWIPSARGYLLSSNHGCLDYLRHQYSMNTEGHDQLVNHALHLNTPRMVRRVKIYLDSCSPGRNYQHSNIRLQFIAGADVTHTKRNHLETFALDQNGRLSYEFDPPVYADTVFLTTDQELSCARPYLLGCTTSDMCPQSPCYHRGTCIGNDVCVCRKGFSGKRCQYSTLTMDDFSFIDLRTSDNTLITNNGNFDIHGYITLYMFEQTRPHGKNAIHAYSKGGHIHLVQTHDATRHKNASARFLGTTSALDGNDPSEFSTSGVVEFNSGHDPSHEVHFYNTHHNFDVNYPGSSLVYSDHVLSMHVHTGTRQYSLSVEWHPVFYRQYHIASSFSPVYGCSIYIDGYLVATATDSMPDTSNTCSCHQPASLCMGSCGYSYIGTNHHLFPSASYWLGPIYFAGMSVPQMALNNKLPWIGLKPTVQLIPTPAVVPTTTKAPTTTTTQARTTRTTTTQAPSTTTTTTTKAPTTTSMHVPTATGTQIPAAATTAAAAATTTVAPTTTPPIRPTPYSATFAGQTTTSSISTGPICYSCTHVSTDGSCSSVKSCAVGEVCAIFHDQKGYTHTCLDKQVCQSAKSLTHGSCWICCDSYLCNKQCAPTVTCDDTKDCAIIKSTGYDVCDDLRVAAIECKKTCGLC